MPQILRNGANKHVVIQAVANDTFQLANAVSIDANTDPVNALNITKIAWTGPWTIARGNSTSSVVVFQSNGDYAGIIDYSGSFGAAQSANNTANIIFTTTSAKATIVIECNKATYANGTAGGL
jgi:hypothetical protein